MPPSDDNDEAGGSRRPSRPFLKKGQGTARFRMTKPAGRPRVPSDAHEIPQAESPAISLPRFTPSSCIPHSARTVDSGISNEDDTRPPTTASLPLDNPSTSPLNNFENHNKTPTVVEEHEEHADHVGSEGDNVERVSAMPSFVPEDGGSSVEEHFSQMSEDALRFRAEAERLKEQAKRLNSMNSVSITPSSYSSNITDPKYFSTPRTEENSFQPPPVHPTSFHSVGSLTAAALETPQARPLSSNRANLMVQNEAQTGISLLNNHQARRLEPSRRIQVSSSSSQDQKENGDDDIRLNALEHVYDQPMQFRRRIQHENKNRTHNMMIQLRDAIAHLDYETENVWSTKKKQEKLREEQKKLGEELEEKTKELNSEREEFEKMRQDHWKNVETFHEDKKAEEERQKREQREIERDRKMLQKETGAKQKEQLEMIANLREKGVTAETQNAKLRQDIRSRDETIKKKDELIEKLTKDYNRSKSTCQTLEKRIKQMRNEKEKEEKEKEMFAKVAGNRMTSYPVNLNQSLGTATTSSASSKNPSGSSLATNRKTPLNKGRTVSFADEPNEQSLEVIEEDVQSELMKRYETVSTLLGPCTLYGDSTGKTTKVTQTISNGLLFEFSNGDFRWVNRQNSVNIYRYAVDKTIVINLALYNISIIYSLQRQLEVYRPDNNITLVSVKRRDVRTELHSLNNGMYYTELFNKNGNYVTKDFCHREVNREIALGTAYSYRDNETRYVQCNTAPDDFELVEPEFRLRWFKGEVMVCKIIGRPQCNEKTLRVEVNLNTGSGTLETVESQLKDGISQKKSVFPWS